GRQQQPLSLEHVAAQTEPFAELKPHLDASGTVSETIVVEDPLDPYPPDFADGATRQEQGVLDRDVLLVIEAVRNPDLKLFAGEASGIHQLMEWVPVVVLLLPHVAQLRGEFVCRPGLHGGLAFPISLR